MNTKVAIIGAGPGGVFCSIYLKRFGIDSIVFEKKEIGGLIRYANLIENFPFLKPISGPNFCDMIKKEAESNKIRVIFETVKKINFKNKFVITTGKNEYFSDYLILATGTEPVIIKEAKNIKKDMLSFWENFFYIKNKEVGIIGGGDVAFDNAVNLSKRKNKVTIIYRGLRCLNILKERCAKDKNINLIGPAEIKKIIKKNGKYEIIFKQKNEEKKYSFDCVISACGRKEYYGGIKNIDKIISYRNLKEKFFLCGDVKNGRFRQAINSVSDAMKIAMKIKELEYEGKS
ncbi:MAG: NAD(P)/FAD-dependent oxidoreductase [Elusimicrobiales bacterium]|nr:NAD(P)/FAD-dependent oxidoreductase [Elusimicrobiales bacterium]